MKEVEKMREETKSITCNCNDICCPFSTAVKSDEESLEGDIEEEDDEFEEERSPDLGFGSMEMIYQRKCNNVKKQFKLPSVSPPLPQQNTSLPLSGSTSLTNIPRGVQKRADGTIIENDYPGFYCSSRKSKKKRRLTGGFSMTHLNRLDVCSVEVPPLADCQVDQDGVITTNKDYRFSREAPERKNIRSPLTYMKRLSLVHTNSNPISTAAYRKISAGPFMCSSIDLTRHSSVPRIEMSLADNLRAKIVLQTSNRHSIAL